MSRVLVRAWPAIQALVISTVIVVAAVAVPALIMYAAV